MTLAWTLIVVGIVGVVGSAWVIVGAMCKAASDADRAFAAWDRERRIGS